MKSIDNVGAANATSISIATIGAISSNKDLSIATVGIFGAASPIPPTPIVGHGQQNEMLICVGEMM